VIAPGDRVVLSGWLASIEGVVLTLLASDEARVLFEGTIVVVPLAYLERAS
jgi:hypothetical protein